MADGHVDLTGRWYPNRVDGCCSSLTRSIRRAETIRSQDHAGGEAFLQAGDGNKKREAIPVWRLRPGRHSEHDIAAAEPARADGVDSNAGKAVVMLDEYPLDVRMIYMNGREHPKDPDPTFNGDSTARWREIRWWWT